MKISRDANLSINWADFSSKLLQSFGNFSIGNAFGGIGRLLEASNAIEIEQSVGSKIWTLFILAFAWSFYELKTEGDPSGESALPLFTGLIKTAKASVDHENALAPSDFLQRPTNLPLYIVLRDAAVRRRADFRAGVHETAETLTAKFDAAFSRAIFEILIRRPEVFQTVVSTLSNPARAPAQRQLDWDAYRQRLVYEFTVKPVFGQEHSKLSLAQLYVPLRASWVEPTKDDGKIKGGEPDRSAPEGERRCDLFDELIGRWIDGPLTKDSLRLVGGGPGSGKSTSLKALASRYALRAEWRTLFVPLQHIELDGDLRDSVNRHFSRRTEGEFSHGPLERAEIEDGPPLLIIFDGLDEIARPGESANEVVNLFATKLNNLIASLRGEGAKSLRVIVSGRMPAFQAARRYLSLSKTNALEVLGFLPLNLHTRQDFYPDEKDISILDEDQRPVWWLQYARLTGHPDAIPEAFTSFQLAGLTHEPLLCYLLVLSGFATANWHEAAENPNRIYRELVNSVWERGWGDGAVKRLGAGRSLTRGDFNALMQTIALAAWQGGDTRVASEAGFHAATKIARTEATWDAFRKDNGSDVTNLAMNFYRKTSEGSQRGFEFTHKSFGDYLTARAILDIANDLPSVIDRRVDHALTEWVSATATGTLSDEILEFLRNEIRLRISENSADGISNAVRLKSSWEKFVNTIIEDGLPTGSGGYTWRESETRQMNSETMAWAVMNALSLGLASQSHPDRMVRLNWTSDDQLSKLIKRLSLSPDYENPVLRCFSYMFAPESNLDGLQLINIDLTGAIMNGSTFMNCSLYDAELVGGNFSSCDFEGTDFSYADCTGANFESCDFTRTILTETILTNANLNDLLVGEICLLDADLELFSMNADRVRITRRNAESAPAVRTFSARAPAVEKIIRKIQEKNQ